MPAQEEPGQEKNHFKELKRNNKRRPQMGSKGRKNVKKPKQDKAKKPEAQKK